MYRVHHGSYVAHWGFRENAVAEVEDVAWPTFHALQDLLDAAADLWRRRKEGHGVEITLDWDVVAHAAPGLVQVYSPVYPEHSAASLSH